MPVFHRRSSSPRRLRPHSPSCRGGASSLLRLAQPGNAPSLSAGADVSGMAQWLVRTAGERLAAALRPPVRPIEFAPSQWLAGR